MLLKWAIGGAVVGAVFSVMSGINIGGGIVLGAIFAVSIRKWIAKNLWM